jgi:hypothetical protein
MAQLASPFDSEEHLFEIKWDGTRTLAFVDHHAYRLANRLRVAMTDSYPEFAFLGQLQPGIKSRWNKCFATWGCSMTCAAEYRHCAVVVLSTKVTAASVPYRSTWARTLSTASKPIARPKGTLWTSGLLTTTTPRGARG